MATITLANAQAADARSREMWTAILGREKYAQDVTEYAFGRDGASIVIDSRSAHLDTLLRADQMTADEIAALVSLYPAWQSGTSYSVGDLVAHSGELYKVIQQHVSQADWTPDAVPALFVNVAPEGVVPEWVAPTGAHDAYNLGDRVTYQGQVWESTINANVWQPGVHGWVVVG